MITEIDVVIPARDEEELLGDAIEAVLASRDDVLLHQHPSHLDRRRREPLLAVRVVVVLDACSDRSADIARSFGRQVEVLEVDFANVGAARAAGVEHLLRSVAPTRLAEHWICTTDADTLVPREWLLDHRRAADDGAGVALGRVSPRSDDLPPEVLQAWNLAHSDTSERHVFGANLGVRADLYRRAGGFPALRVGEDEALVVAIEALGHESGDGVIPPFTIMELRSSVADTSGRRDGRTPGGFSGYLRELAE